MASPTTEDGPAADERPRRDGPARQYVGFRLDGAHYAVPIREVQEIILPPPITRLPMVSVDVEGLINLRGRVLPVVCLRKRFGLPDRPADVQPRIVVVEVAEKAIGLIVDTMTQVMKVGEDDLQPAPPGVATVAPEAIAGLVRSGDGLVLALDLGRLLDHGDFGLPTSP